MVQYGLSLVLYSTSFTQVRENHYTSILCLEVLFIDFTNLKFIFDKNISRKSNKDVLKYWFSKSNLVNFYPNTRSLIYISLYLSDLFEYDLDSHGTKLQM